MPKRVLDVGNCDYDHSQIQALIEGHFDAMVVRCHGPEDAISELQASAADLVIVNRLLDRDHSEGLEIIRQIKGDKVLAKTPCMLLTNHAEHEATAIAAGAEPGFGKRAIREKSTIERLEKYLGT